MKYQTNKTSMDFNLEPVGVVLYFTDTTTVFFPQESAPNPAIEVPAKEFSASVVILRRLRIGLVKL
jgi:hypothetical protein